MSLTVRCRGPNGQCTLSGVEPGMSTQAFLALLSEKTGVPAASMEILTGFPPKAVQITPDGTVSSMALANGDTLTVRPGAAADQPALTTPPPPQLQPQQQQQLLPPVRDTASTASGPTQTHDTPQGVGTATDAFGDMSYMDEDEMLARAIAASLEGVPAIEGLGAGASSGQGVYSGQHNIQQQQQRRVEEVGASSRRMTGTNGSAVTGGPAPQSIPVSGGGGSCVVRRVIDSDNSCLFNAVGYVMDRSRVKADALRTIVAEVVSNDPITFNDGFLGKDVQEYCSWIQQKDKWGGAIELFILSQHYGREIAAFDIQTKRCDVYGQDKGYEERALLIYDGLHYDALAVAAFEGAPEELDVTMFRSQGAESEAIMAAAEKLVAATHVARQFTDTANFKLRCGVCQIGLKGEKEAVEHAKATGHSNFAEY